MFGADQTLLIRALNATRHSQFPTYIGLRLIASQLPPIENSYLRRALIRRLASGDKWNFRSFDLFKGAGRSGIEGSHEYRACLAPSPLTSLAESFVLAKLASMPSFAVPACAYSYLWPKSAWSGSSYEYFVEGYKRRNLAVAQALPHVPGAHGR